MQKQKISAITGPVDLSRINLIVDTSSERTLTSYLFETFSARGRTRTIVQNANRFIPPTAYQKGNRLYVLAEYLVFAFDLNDLKAEPTVENIHYLTTDALDTPHGVLIMHEAGCTLLSHDLTDVHWIIDDRRVQTCVFEDGVLRAYFGEHQSVVIDLTTGRKIAFEEARAPVVAANESEPTERDRKSNVITFLPRRS